MNGLTVWGEPVDQGAYEQISECMADARAVAGALMADHHRGYSMPIGGVIAYDGAVSPTGVGFDIGCGNKAVMTDLVEDDLPPVRELMLEVQERVAFGVGRKSPRPVEHDVLEDSLWDELDDLCPGLHTLAREQLGTVGSGNHYVDLLADGHKRVWVANHFGSRGPGHKIASGFLNLATGRAFTDRAPDQEEPAVLDLATPSGETYMAAMALAGWYAHAGRDAVMDEVLAIIDAKAAAEIHNHHNFAWREHGLIVVRKGATPLTPDPSFVGGSMGDDSAIVKLRDGADTWGTHLGSAPHGAGRLMSRTQAAGKFVKVTGTDGRKRRVRGGGGLVDWDATKADLETRGVVVLGAGADEAPQVYKGLRNVLELHADTVEVVEWLRPVGVVMAGEDVYDPYKD